MGYCLGKTLFLAIFFTSSYWWNTIDNIITYHVGNIIMSYFQPLFYMFSPGEGLLTKILYSQASNDLAKFLVVSKDRRRCGNLRLRQKMNHIDGIKIGQKCEQCVCKICTLAISGSSTIHSGPFLPFWAICFFFWLFWAFLTILGHLGDSGPYWPIWAFLNHSWPFWAILGLLGNFLCVILCCTWNSHQSQTLSFWRPGFHSSKSLKMCCSRVVQGCSPESRIQKSCKEWCETWSQSSWKLWILTGQNTSIWFLNSLNSSTFWNFNSLNFELFVQYTFWTP